MRLKNVCRYKVGQKVRHRHNGVFEVVEILFNTDNRRFLVKVSSGTWHWADVPYLEPANENTTDDVPVVQRDDRPNMLLGRPVIWPDDPEHSSEVQSSLDRVTPFPEMRHTEYTPSGTEGVHWRYVPVVYPEQVPVNAQIRWIDGTQPRAT